MYGGGHVCRAMGKGGGAGAERKGYSCQARGGGGEGWGRDKKSRPQADDLCNIEGDGGENARQRRADEVSPLLLRRPSWVNGAPVGMAKGGQVGSGG